MVFTPYIKQKIEARFGRPVRYSKDCDILSKSIEKVCKERISTTTLKRLFGFAKSIENPRLFTLDVLACYINYKDWSSLIAELEKLEKMDIYKDSSFSKPTKIEDIYTLQQQLVLSVTTQNIDVLKVFKLCQQFGSKKEITSFIIDLINIAAQTKNIRFFNHIFLLPKIFDDSIHLQEQIYYIGQTIGLAFRTNPDLCTELIETYASNKKAQTYLIEWFVDEDYLQSYYGQLLDNYHLFKKKSMQDRLFYYSLKYSQCMQSGDVIQQKEWYCKIKKISLNKALHPIPAGRYIGICVSEESNELYGNSSIYYNLIVNHLVNDTYENAITFLLYLSRYLFKSDRTDWLIGLVNKFEKEWDSKLEKFRSHWGVKTENELFIYLSYAFYLTGNIKKAKLYIKKVDPDLFEVFMYKQIHNDYSDVLKIIFK